MLERYCSITESAAFLSKETGEKVSSRGVLDLAARGELRLCIWFNGTTELYCYYPHSSPQLEQMITNKWVKGYIQIPKENIAPEHRKFNIPYAVIIETYDSGNNEDTWLARGETMIAIRPIKSFNENTHKVEYDAIIVDTENALIPTLDLMELVSKNKEIYRLHADKPLSTTERNTLLTIIGLMAKDGYGDDLKKPFALAGEILKAGEESGIKLSDQTIADKLKEARKVLQEKTR